MRAQSIRRRLRVAPALCVPLALAGLGCEGSGNAGEGLRVELGSPDPGCTRVAGDFPSGFALNPDDVNRAALVQFNPPAVVIFGLDGEAPVALAQHTFAPDSDIDGVDDALRSQQEGFYPL